MKKSKTFVELTKKWRFSVKMPKGN